jgi:1,4-dihydroxy-2-naphthoate octaprenyltransferase
MTGTPPTEHGESNGRDDAGAESPVGAAAEAKEQGFPWQLGLAVVAWVVLGALLIVSALGSSSTSGGADQASVDKIQGTLGDSAVATNTTAHPTLMLLLGLVVLLMALLLLIGQGWARLALGVLGVLAVILFAVGGRWEAIIAFAALIVGTVPLLAPSAHRYLTSS